MIYAESWNGDVKITFPCGCEIQINIWHGENEDFDIAGETEAEAEFSPCEKHKDRDGLRRFIKSAGYEIAETISSHLGLSLYELCRKDKVKVDFPIEDLKSMVEEEFEEEFDEA